MQVMAIHRVHQILKNYYSMQNFSQRNIFTIIPTQAPLFNLGPDI